MRKVLIYVVMMMLLTTSLVAQNSRTQTVAPNNLRWIEAAGYIKLDWDHGFHEDFADGEAQNFEFSHPDKFSIVNNNLKMSSTVADRNTWASAYYDEDFDNFELEFRFRRNQSTATQENSMGVLIRSQHGHMNNTPTAGEIQGASGYLVVIKSTGAYSFWKMDNGVASMIKTWTNSNYINTGLGNPNIFRVNASGNQIGLYMNGYFVDQFTDNSYTNGKIALCTYDSNAGTNELLWHYVKVTPTQMNRSYTSDISNIVYPLATEELNPEYSNLPAISNPYRGLDDVPSAVSYDIYRNEELHASTNDRTFTETDAYDQGNYQYYVVAKYDQGEDADPQYLYSEASNVVYVEHFEPVPAESVIISTIVGYNVSLEWGQPQGAAFEACTGYKVFLNNETTARATITDKETTEATISAPAGTHTVSVVATYTRGDSDEVVSDEFNVHNLQPVQNIETTVDGTEITFTFDVPTGTPEPAPFGYRLSEVIGWIAHERDLIDFDDALEFVYDVVTPGVYNFRISARYENYVREGESTYYSVDTDFSVTVDNIKPVTNLAVTAIGQKLNFTWNAPVVAAPDDFTPNPTSYRIRVIQNGPVEIFDETVASNVFEYTSVDLAFGNYQYFVYAVYANGENGQSAFKYIDNPLPVTEITTAIVNSNEVSINWTSPTNDTHTKGLLIYRVIGQTETLLNTQTNGSVDFISISSAFIDRNRDSENEVIYGPRTYKVVVVWPNYLAPDYPGYLAPTSETPTNDAVSGSFTVNELYPRPLNLAIEQTDHRLNGEVWVSDVELTWDAPDGVNPTGYYIYKAIVGAEGDLTYNILDNSLAGTAVNFTDTSLLPGTHYYSVKAEYDNDDTHLSSETFVEITLTDIFPVPTNLVITHTPEEYATNHDIILNWDAPVATDDFDLIRYEIRENNVLIHTITNVNTRTYTDTDRDDNATYNYKVFAVYRNPEDEFGENRKSSPLVGTHSIPDYDAPTDVQPVENLHVHLIDTKEVTLTWTIPNTTTPADLDGFYVYRGSSTTPIAKAYLNAANDGYVGDSAGFGINGSFSFTQTLDENDAYGDYTYRVSAIYNYVEEDLDAEPIVEESFDESEERSVIAHVDEFPRVRDLTYSFNGSAVVLNWIHPFNNDDTYNALVGFNVYRKIGNAQTFEVLHNELNPYYGGGATDANHLYTYVDNNIPLNVEVTYQVEAIYTTAESPRLSVSLTKTSYYTTVWHGIQPIKYMNIYIAEAFVDGEVLGEGTEIAVFEVDGINRGKCVGAVTLTAGQNGQLFDPYIHIPVAAEEENVNDGFTVGENFVFSVYRNGIEYTNEMNISNNPVYFNTIFVQGDDELVLPASANVPIVRFADKYHSQDISLITGWNIIGSSVTGTWDMSDIFDELPGFARVLNSSDDYPTNADFTYEKDQAYYVRVTQNTSLGLTGTSVFYEEDTGIIIEEDLDITFTGALDDGMLRGWFLVPNPYKFAFDPMSLLAAQDLLKPAGDTYTGPVKKIMSQTGSAIEITESGQLINNIGNFMPGQGYLFYVEYAEGDEAPTLTFPASPINNRSNDENFIPELIEPSYFAKNWSGNGWMHFNMYVAVDDYILANLSVGDEIAIFDGENCVGVTVYNGHENFIPVVASLNEDLDGVVNGYNPANPFSVKIRFADSNTVVDAPSYQITQGSNLFEVNGTSIVQFSDFTSATDIVLPAITDISAIYPNPFNPTTNIRFSNRVAGNVSLDVYNIKGQKVKTLASGHYEAGHYQVTWNGDDSTGRKVGSGIYFTRLVTEDKQVIKKMVLVK